MSNPYRQLAHALENDWTLRARPSQLPPPGEWSFWCVVAGRGFGKTRTGVEFVKAQVEAGLARRVAIVAPTAADCRDILVEGESGILATASPWCMPAYEPSKRRLTWPSGAIATLYSAEDPDSLRGQNSDLAYCDELAAWRDPSAFDMLLLGLRLGRHPRCVITTTPRPTKIIKDLLAREGRDVVVTRGTTYDNRQNLAPSFFAQIIRRYEGTRLGRQELDGALLEDVEGALWSRALLDGTRVKDAPRDLERVVVAIDPAVTSGEDADETGLVVAGLGCDGHVYVLADLSGRHAPMEWARRAVAAYHLHKADAIIGEANNGGDLIETTIRQVDPNVAYRAVHASRGKAVRAEPCAALWEQGRAHLVGALPQLEDQMATWAVGLDRRTQGSPDRVDALVWAVTSLAIEQAPGQGLIDWYVQEARKLGATERELSVPLPKADEAFFHEFAETTPKPTRMRAPDIWQSTFYGIAGRRYDFKAGEVFDADSGDVPPLRRNGFVEVAGEAMISTVNTE